MEKENLLKSQQLTQMICHQVPPVLDLKAFLRKGPLDKSWLQTKKRKQKPDCVDGVSCTAIIAGGPVANAFLLVQHKTQLIS